MSLLSKPRILLVDIETSPLLVYSWGLGQQFITLDQLKEDWSILSWCAKWANEKEVMYRDTRRERDPRNDKTILKEIWDLLDQADIVVTQNGKRFDIPKLFARFKIHKFKKPSSFKQTDTYRLAKRNFGFTSHKLQYMTDKLCNKYKKTKHSKFPGLELWDKCLQGNREAWRELEDYNKADVLALEELYYEFVPWDNTIDFNLYTDEAVTNCNCGSTSWCKNGFAYTSTGKYQRYKCQDCGSEVRDNINLFNKEKVQTLKRRIND